MLAGRANDVLPSVLGDLPAEVTAIVMTTWAFGYFSIDERAEFVELLRAASDRQPVAWISAENRGVVEALDTGPGSESSDEILGALLINGGNVEACPLARVHSHGNWIDWLTGT